MRTPFFEDIDISNKKLFQLLFNVRTEPELNELIKSYPKIFNNQNNWYPLGGDKSTFGVIENRQASPIPALIEKIAGSYRCYFNEKML